MRNRKRVNSRIAVALAVVALMVSALSSVAADDDSWVTNGGNTTVTGNVGIGTRNPEAALHVNGEFRSNWGEGFSMFGDIDYFGQWQDGIVFQMRDNNSQRRAY
jgi:hypothetical protein